MTVYNSLKHNLKSTHQLNVWVKHMKIINSTPEFSFTTAAIVYLVSLLSVNQTHKYNPNTNTQKLLFHCIGYAILWLILISHYKHNK